MKRILFLPAPAYTLHVDATAVDTLYVHIMMTIYIYNCLNSDLHENCKTYFISSMFRNKMFLWHTLCNIISHLNNTAICCRLQVVLNIAVSKTMVSNIKVLWEIGELWLLTLMFNRQLSFLFLH